MGLWNTVFGGADGCRQAVRDTYAKYVRLAKNGQSPGRESLHAVGLHEALSARYRARGIVREGGIWDELAPFLAMEEQAAVAVLAEYVVFQEHPKDSRVPLLKEALNAALQSLTKESYRKLAALAVINQVAWCALLTSDTVQMIEVSIDQLSQEL